MHMKMTQEGITIHVLFPLISAVVSTKDWQHILVIQLNFSILSLFNRGHVYTLI